MYGLYHPCVRLAVMWEMTRDLGLTVTVSLLNVIRSKLRYVFIQMPNVASWPFHFEHLGPIVPYHEEGPRYPSM
jgi:hypothetical protein